VGHPRRHSADGRDLGRLTEWRGGRREGDVRDRAPAADEDKKLSPRVRAPKRAWLVNRILAPTMPSRATQPA
jgi:hypothetical protein